ncbi:MBL fold metallo-hydrolase [Halobacteriales archaeon QS_1_68_20]|nr:MAG: MBL fold metallo-hydrolase [Halobacteriales archaeon QS_1_68_20]
MRVTFLGTGSAMPTGERVQTGILLEGADRRLLVDCGSGVLHRLAQVADYEDVGHVLLTHHHLDHVSDLLALLKARWLAGAESLSVAGPPGTESMIADLLSVHDYLQDRVDLSVRDVETGSFSFAGFDVEAMETRHSMQCFAYRFEDRFSFSGDSEAFPELASFADGCTALAHDCSFPDEVDVSNHPTPTQLGEALSGVDVGTVYLTHLYPHTDGNHEAMLDSIADHYDGDVEFAEDRLTVSV